MLFRSRTQRAKVITESGLYADPNKLPELFEILPTGNAWRFGADAKENPICQLCDRRQFLKLSRWNIDPQRWDGSDFFNLEMNPNMIFVTQRVKDLFDGQNLSNYVCLPLSVQEEATVRLMKIRNGSLK